MEQFEQGDLEAARQSLRRVDHMQLPPNQRVRLFRTLQEIDRQTADAVEANGDAEAEEEVEWIALSPEELLSQADQMASEDPDAASQLYRQVIADEQASDSERGQASASLAQLRRQANRELTITREQIDLANQALERGDHAEAIERLERVQASGVSLGWFDQQRVERQLALAQRQHEASRPAEQEEVAETEAVEVAAEEDEREAVAAVVEAPAEEPADEVAEEITEVAVAEAGAEEAANGEPAARDDLFQRARSLRHQEFLAEARIAEEEGNIELAIRRYEAARELDPNHEETVDRLRALRARRQQALAPDDLISRERMDRDLRAQQAVADVRSSLNTARNRLEGGNYTAARDAVDRARVTLDREQRFLPPAQYRDLRDSAEQLAITINEQRDEEEARRQWVALQQEERDRRDARVTAERERREQINELLTRAMEMRLEMRYDRALELVDRALAIDPMNVAAQAMKMGIEDGQVLVNFREQRQDRDRRIAQQRALNIEATQPYTDLVTYPHDWPELTVRRLADMDDSMGETEANRATRAALREPLPVNFEANRLVNVIDYFRDATEQNFFVNWGALEMAGVDQDTPVSLQLSNVPAERALNLVLAQASSDFEPVQFSVIDGIVHVSTEADLRRTTDTRVYDIRDLLVQVPNFDNAPRFDLESALDSDHVGGGRGGRGGGGGGGRGGGGGGGGRGGLFGDTGSDEDPDFRTRAEMIEEIEDLVRSTVGRIDDWDEFGGDVSSMREYNGNLIIRSTADNHRSVIDLLSQLRETRAIQISVEARFLLVDQNFLENIGVDFDFQIDSPGGNFGPIRFGQDSASITNNPQTDRTPGRFQPGTSIGRPTGFGPDGFNRTGRSLDLGVSYLDDLEVNLLVHATQASQRSVSLTAPRVTFFNGQTAFVVVAQQFAFISDLEPIPDAAGFNQELSVVNSGVVLQVQGTVSADRRYVTMTLQPSLAQLDAIRQITQNAVVTIPGPGDNEVAIPISATLEAPTLQITEVAATVSVPDGGTLLLGGQRLVDEIEIEAGVPVLSKVPFINRLFTNTSTVKDERTLLILVKPSIIIQHEEEENLYPGLLDDPASYDRRSRF
ncbi:hypothetical protein ACERK3_10020 [Phycisphaerales bacterium AB-hyl4]|uniref:Type II/III secretion system secretin-like domain-containing protein n=1 Tax=Natronomicrosphaera hydrolytica TaxID=3242702 RepID=A0ABV4U7A5_9BACT